MSLKEVASTCHHSDDEAKEKTLCVEQVDHARSHLAMIRANRDASVEKLKGVEQKIVDLEEALLGRGASLTASVQGQSIPLEAVKKEIDVKSKVLLTLRWCLLSRLMMQMSWRSMSRSC